MKQSSASVRTLVRARLRACGAVGQGRAHERRTGARSVNFPIIRSGPNRRTGTRSALLLSRSEDGTLDFDLSPIVILSAEQAKHVGDEENQQYCPQHAGP